MAGAAQLRFCFLLELTFDAAMNSCGRANVQVIDYATTAEGGKLPPPLQPLATPWLRFRRIWARPLGRLPVWKDLPRLMKGLRVTTPSHAGGDVEMCVHSPAPRTAPRVLLQPLAAACAPRCRYVHNPEERAADSMQTLIPFLAEQVFTQRCDCRGVTSEV